MNEHRSALSDLLKIFTLTRADIIDCLLVCFLSVLWSHFYLFYLFLFVLSVSQGIFWKQNSWCFNFKFVVYSNLNIPVLFLQNLLSVLFLQNLLSYISTCSKAISGNGLKWAGNLWRRLFYEWAPLCSEQPMKNIHIDKY